MKVQYTIYDMDPLSVEHLKKNIAFDNIDLVFMARKTADNIEKSRVNKLIRGNARIMIDMFKDRSDSIVNKVDDMINFDVDSFENGDIVLTLFISEDYFLAGDTIEAQFGRMGKRLIHFATRQKIIDGVENQLRNLYCVNYEGLILEGDSKKLRVGHS